MKYKYKIYNLINNIYIYYIVKLIFLKMVYGTCVIIGCRFNTEHVTVRHCCGTCKHNGHGQVECKTQELLVNLEQFKGDFIRNPCTIPECIDSYTHTTEGHSCLYCDKRDINNHLPRCPNNKNTTFYNKIFDDVLHFNSTITDYIKDVEVDINTYKKINAGMGCMWIIRNNTNDNNNNYENYEYLFMHSDNWGQYGDDTSDLPRYKAFIYGYTLVE